MWEPFREVYHAGTEESDINTILLEQSRDDQRGGGVFKKFRATCTLQMSQTKKSDLEGGREARHLVMTVKVKP